MASGKPGQLFSTVRKSNNQDQFLRTPAKAVCDKQSGNSFGQGVPPARQRHLAHLNPFKSQPRSTSNTGSMSRYRSVSACQ